MSSSHPYLGDLASLIGNAAALHALYIMLNQDLADRSDVTGLMIWWIGLAAIYLAMAVCLHILRMPTLAPAVTFAGAALQALALWHYGQAPDSLLGWLWILFFWGIPLFRANEFIRKPATSEQRTLDFEISVLTLIALAVACAGGALPLSAMLPCIFAALFLLLALASGRTAGHPGNGNILSILVTLAIPAAVIGLCVLLLIPLQSSLTSGLHGVAGWMTAAGQAAARVLHAFFAFLFALLPASDTDTILPEAETQAAMDLDSSSSMLSVDAVMTPILILLLITGAAMILILSARKLPLPEKDLPVLRRAKSFTDSLRELFFGLIRRLRFRAAYLTHRHTAEGLFCWIEFHMASRRDGRHPEETPRMFLQRASASFPGCEEELTRLTGWLEDRYFAPDASAPDPDLFRKTEEHLKQSFRNAGSAQST